MAATASRPRPRGSALRPHVAIPHRFDPKPPDSMPAVVLRLELARLRRSGECTFIEAWDLAVERALAGLRTGQDVQQWERAFTATQVSWARAWRRESNPCLSTLSVAMITVDPW